MGLHGDHDMGHTVAGWTGTGAGVLGSVVTGAALARGAVIGVWLGCIVIALAALTTWVLHLAGWGKASGPRPPGRQHWRMRDTTARRGHPGCVGCRLAGRRGPRTSEAVPVAVPVRL
ncbi:hypothetical protein A8W25_01795 [Streptomyces sp. ERV7]|uniref:HGxxPAAW family protein n=1 Tax=Streptomyces sp. ERV7 TaxID=1322334 RepID=UPI0007F50E88|nr:HGxxPAAW family protein [Streptomyces sp. ERV7]OAR27037.1 hypothetical protein A8W25_01795 [Streptomyces sp. ERV7]